MSEKKEESEKKRINKKERINNNERRSESGDSINQKIGYALPSVTVPSNSKPQCYEWKQFKQPDLDKEHEVISGEEAAKHVEKIIFYFWIQPKEEYYAIEQFEFIAIGTNRDE